MLFFYLKKVIGMLLMPIPLTLMALLLALLLWQKWPKISKLLVAGAGIWLALTSWQPVADQLLMPFESRYPMFDIEQPVQAVVVLGGCHVSDDSMPVASQLCSSSLYRLLEGIRILQANPEASLLLSGYAGVDARPHALVMQEVAMTLGVPLAQIRVFIQPKDTEEEALAMQPWLADKRFALVSEASHLPRAMQFFERLGLAPMAAPAVRLSVVESDWRIEARAALKSERAIYELLGLIWQKLKN